MKTIFKLNGTTLRLYDVSENSKNFICVGKDLSDFEMHALRWVGNAIRPRTSQHFWSDGCYCWYTDKTQRHEQCVWLTDNGIAMFEDRNEGKLYRVGFEY